jgi:hypothetical protein
MRRVDDDERRARLGRRHHLAVDARAGDVVDVARGLVALHSTDPASVFLSAAARMRAPAVADVERALYEDRSLVRMLGMRRTMFVVPADLVPVVHAGATAAIATRERRRLVQQLEAAGLATDGGRWLRALEEATLAALADLGEATGAELSTAVPGLGRQLLVGQGTKWEGYVGLSTRVLFVLAADGRVVRGRPRGSWTSSQYRWAPAESWLPRGAPVLPVPEAQAALARLWLEAYGPATAADLKWWTGWSAAEVKRALAAVAAAEVALEEGAGLVLESQVDPVAPSDPWAALLPALDPTVMGWTARRWFLADHRPRLFDRSGNPGPTVWWDGRIVGGWAQRPAGDIVYRLFDDVGADAVAAVDAAAERLAAWIGPVRVTPRFRTPLERELSAEDGPGGRTMRP